MDGLAEFADTQTDWESLAKRIDPGLWKCLAAAGFVRAASFETISDLTDLERCKELDAVIGRTATFQEQEHFKSLVSTSLSFASHKRKMVIAAFNRPELRRNKILPMVYTEREMLVVSMQPKTQAAFPTSSRRKKQSKEEIRCKLALQIGKILVECQFPSAELVVGSRAPERLVGRFGGGKRSSTLAHKISSYNSMRSWMIASFGKCFPTLVIEAVDYVLERAEEPCGPTVPSDILATINFFEGIGGVLGSDRVGASVTFKAIVDDLKIELAAAKPRRKRKAHQILLCMIAAWEVGVCNTKLSNVYRTQLWTKLIKVWASLRTADLAGIPARSLSFTAGVLTGSIMLSKMTGVGKRIGETNFWVSADAWLVEPKWLKVGWEIYLLFSTDRSYFLPLPTKDLATFSDQEPDYAQWCTTDRRLLSETGELVKIGHVDGFMDNWACTDSAVLLTGAQSFWAGHSDRSTLNTWAASLGKTKSQRNPLGRWQPEGSDEYTRVSKELVLEIQDEVATRARAANGKDVFHEAGLLRELAVFCAERKMDDLEIENMILKLSEGRDLIGGIETADIPELDVIPSVDSSSDLEEEPPILSLGERVVSLSKGGAKRTLHKVGSCWRRPGVHFARYHVLDLGEVGQYNTLCRDCYPKQIDTDIVKDSDSEEPDSSSSSDSSASN